MKSNRQSSIWPYLGILLCLFVLSLAATRTWQQLRGPDADFIEWEDDDELLADGSSATDMDADAEEPVAKDRPFARDEPAATDEGAVANTYEATAGQSQDGAESS